MSSIQRKMHVCTAKKLEGLSLKTTAEFTLNRYVIVAPKTRLSMRYAWLINLLLLSVFPHPLPPSIQKPFRIAIASLL
jgi:hypothetical protein